MINIHVFAVKYNIMIMYMKETIVRFERGPFPKKYTAYIKNKKTKNVLDK